ncbi:Eco57I restriction-modification methylase domain-containing protein [Altibacter sp. HG106]|uniref:Eco57I restriction-modification methylase domain-containing protein n=1 Tax=Altibacter sp. HG106 TaxID=3023937 RepID=UPI00234FEAB8|nr:TaqI-like C-terminal specificity domain-containing protein [Altibacter sp. HG106]MDC7995516.1 TaqI-like C-terminal specificity domain-containing protein [Altibacter sp. HG106]
MDKNSAINLIDKTFNNAFDEAQFTNFIQNLLNDFEIKQNKYSGNTIWEDQRDHVSYYKRIGKYIDPEGEALDVLIVQVKNVSKLERARTALRNFVIKHLNNFEKDYALVAFYSKEDDGFDWRFSFIKMEHQSYLDEEKQKVKMRKEFTPAKRYSFLVGKYEKSHTAKTQLLPLLQNIANNPTISELEKAFSIERVTDEFFEQYKSLYIKVYEYFEKQDLSIFQDSQLDASGFTKKLLGQIVFLYFLQKKGWLGVPRNERWGFGDKHFVQKLFEKAQQENLNFFKDYLQYLFYEALAKERDNDNSFYPRFNCRIPFLNGGLFEAQYDWQNANFVIPTELFRNDEKNKSGDIGTGILDVFDRYNFTIKEDEPLDKEVAVDPEMLGKVFENMLEIKERKSKGAFYTPREIVHYMCQESLIHYLDNALNNYNNTYQELGDDQTNMFGNQGKTGQQTIQAETNEIIVPKKDIEQYIREGHLALENDVRVAERGETKTYKFLLPESVRNNADFIDKKLTEIRICDPAIGSGAFPVGLLHELVTAQLLLKPHLSNNYLKEKLLKFELIESEPALSEVEVSESRYVYRLKKHIIQESIYGVDIDRSAIDIARLRLWLSLVVDEDDLEPIETLPNLDYKIVCGNSLVGLPPQGADRYPTLKDELETLKKKFYKETNEKEKKSLRKRINDKIQTVLKTAEDFEGYTIDFDFELFFSEVWKKKGGFDVIIGNPPYLSISKVDYKDILKEIKYETFVSTGDLYVLFYENCFRKLKNRGNLNLITSNKWINASYGKKSRNFFSTKTNPILLIDFAKVRIFPNATVFVNILMLENSFPEKKVKAVAMQGDKLPNVSLATYFLNNSVKIRLDGEQVWKIGTEEEIRINRIIESKGTKLLRWHKLEFFRGITTGYNKAFHFNEDVKDELIKKEPKANKYIYPLLRGKDIKRWKYEYDDNYMLFIPWHFPLQDDLSITKASQKAEVAFKNDYPYLYNYLEGFKNELSDRNKSETGIRYEWYALQRYGSNYWNEFLNEKIVWIEISNKANFAYDSESHFLTNSAYFISGDNLKYLTGVLNSSVSDYYFFQITAKIAGGRKRYTKQYVEQIPIPQIKKEEQKPYEVLVDYVISSKSLNQNEEFSFYELLLDSIVFELYFQEEFQSANKSILKHLSDLKPIREGMSEEEKLGIIQSEYERLYHPDHPVRFAIETLDSIEEVRIIREALKS